VVINAWVLPAPPAADPISRRVQNLIGCDRNGAVLNARGNTRTGKKGLRGCIDFTSFSTLHEALHGPDVFIGVSAGNLLKPSDLEVMAPDRIVFAMANPEPEISPELAMPLCRILATGHPIFPIRSIICWHSPDFPRCFGCSRSGDQRAG